LFLVPCYSLFTIDCLYAIDYSLLLMNLFSLFSIGFVLGLTGAMAPGPLLTVTISESTRKGGIVGPLLDNERI